MYVIVDFKGKRRAVGQELAYGGAVAVALCLQRSGSGEIMITLN